MFITCAKRRFDNYYDYSSHQPERYLELEYHSGFWSQPQQQHVPPPECTQDEKATQPGQLLKLGPPFLSFTQICSHLFLQSLVRIIWHRTYVLPFVTSGRSIVLSVEDSSIVCATFCWGTTLPWMREIRQHNKCLWFVFKQHTVSSAVGSDLVSLVGESVA